MKLEQQAFNERCPFETTVPNARMTEKKIVKFSTGSRIYALAAMLALCVVGAGYLFMRAVHTPQTRIKGETKLETFVQEKNGAIVSRQDRRFFVNEKIQFVYSCDENRYLILMSVDSGGTMAVYFPASGDSSFALEPGQDIPLPKSIVLDEYTGSELFLGIFSKKPLSVAAAKKRVRDAFKYNGSIDTIDLELPESVVLPFFCEISERDSP